MDVLAGFGTDSVSDMLVCVYSLLGEFAYLDRIRYTAFGENFATLNCTGEVKEDADWNKTGKPWQMKVTNCGPVDLKIVASEITGVA